MNGEIVFRHLIFEYLPHKELSSSSNSMNEEKDDNLSSSANSVIDKLLGRLPIWPSPPPSLTDGGLELLNLLQQQTKKESCELNHTETNRNSVSIVDRLNEAIRQAQCNNNTDHRIAVQA